MNNSIIEEKFISWCKTINPNINANLFINLYNNYYENYIDSIEKLFKNTYSEISSKDSSFDFFQRGRLKSKHSFFIKTFTNMADNIYNTFSSNEDQEKNIEKYFGFLKDVNLDNYYKTKTIIESFSNKLDPIDCFNLIFNNLSKSEQTILISSLGKTEDLFAFKRVIKNLNYKIKDVYCDENGSFVAIDDNNNHINIKTAKKLNLNTDIVTENNITYILKNNKKEKLNTDNLLYDSSISHSNRTIDNVKLDSKNNLTLLGDSIMLENGKIIDILSLNKDFETNEIFINDTHDNKLSLTSILKDNTIILKRYDEDSIIEKIYEISDKTKSYYKENNIKVIPNKEKDYIKNPKDDSKYMALHNSYYDKDINLSFEIQDESISMYNSSKANSPVEGHDTFKKSKVEKNKENPILNNILEKDPLAFDTSSEALKTLLTVPGFDPKEVLAKYIMAFNLNGKTYISKPTISEIFEHTFHSSYEDFISNQKNIDNDARI